MKGWKGGPCPDAFSAAQEPVTGNDVPRLGEPAPDAMSQSKEGEDDAPVPGANSEVETSSGVATLCQDWKGKQLPVVGQQSCGT